MSNDPISNPPISPTPKVPEFGRDHPRLAEGEEAQEPKPFSLPPESGKPGAAQNPLADKPSPMDLAREGAQQTTQLTPEELNTTIKKLSNKLGDVKNKLQNPDVTNKLIEDHYTALSRVVDKMNPDMKTIARTSQQEFNPTQKGQGEGVVSYVTRWINGSQETLAGALNYASDANTLDPTSYLKLQYAVQRASQRGELFATIVGSSVSGIKSVLATQLG